MASYSVNGQANPETDRVEFVVVDSSGIAVPPPHTFLTHKAAKVRRSELEKEAELKLIAKWNAVPPAPRQRCCGKIQAAAGNVLTRSLGMGRYALHHRTDTEALAKLEGGKTVLITDSKVKYDLEQGSALEL